jgi:uncharacterized protein (DUF433 family)
MDALAYPHIQVDSNGVAMIAGTTTKVVEIVLDRLAHHWDADEIRRQHPHLSLGQIHSALAYYYDHQADLDREVEQRLAREDEIFARLGESKLLPKLLAARRGR